MRPGISFSASSISLRPKAARERSATLNLDAGADMIVVGDDVRMICSRFGMGRFVVIVVFGGERVVEGKFYRGVKRREANMRGWRGRSREASEKEMGQG